MKLKYSETEINTIPNKKINPSIKLYMRQYNDDRNCQRRPNETLHTKKNTMYSTVRFMASARQTV